MKSQHARTSRCLLLLSLTASNAWAATPPGENPALRRFVDQATEPARLRVQMTETVEAYLRERSMQHDVLHDPTANDNHSLREAMYRDQVMSRLAEKHQKLRETHSKLLPPHPNDLPVERTFSIFKEAENTELQRELDEITRAMQRERALLRQLAEERWHLDKDRLRESSRAQKVISWMKQRYLLLASQLDRNIAKGSGAASVLILAPQLVQKTIDSLPATNPNQSPLIRSGAVTDRARASRSASSVTESSDHSELARASSARLGVEKLDR